MQCRESVFAREMAGKSTGPKCPFDCQVKQCTATTTLSRSSSFRSYVQSGRRTVCYVVTPSGNIEDPGKTESSDAKSIPEETDGFKNMWGWTAHHLIPCGAMKNHKLIKYLKKGVSGAKVGCDAGYNINGARNGMWLIAVTRARGGIWEKIKNASGGGGGNSKVAEILNTASGLEKKGKLSVYSQIAKDARAGKSGGAGAFRELLFDTMKKHSRQFHSGGHKSYNDFVSKVLGKVFVDLRRQRKACLGKTNSSCPARGNKAKRRAPHIVTRRLANISDRLALCLLGDGTKWREPVFTSEFARMYAKAARRTKT